MPPPPKITVALLFAAALACAGCWTSESQKPSHSTQPSGQPSQVKAQDLVCGMTVDPRSADTLKLEYKGKIYYFCGESCRKDFQANPEKYLQKGAAEVQATVKDLVCGMDVDPRASSTLKTQYKAKAYYFCSEHCKTGFETNPESYVQKQVPGLEPHISGMME